MFSWSTSATRSQPSPGYPGARTSSRSPQRAQIISGSIRPPEVSRAQHIESYLNDDTLKRSTRRVSTDDSTYDTVFQTTRGDTLIVRVHFPHQQIGSAVKHRAPAMSLAGVRARHAWLDSRMRIVGYDPISTDDTWKASRLLLGQAVHEVVKHLQLEPPEILEITDAGLLSIQTNQSKYKQQQQQRSSSSSSSNGQHQTSTTSQQNGGGSLVQRGRTSSDSPPEYSAVLLDMPDIPREFKELDSLSREELDELLEDELEFTSFVNRLPTYQAIQSIASDILEENVVVAKANLEKKDTIQTLYAEVMELKKELESKLTVFQSLEKEQDAICAPPDTNDVMRQLARGKKEAFQASERMAEEWVEQVTDVDTFVKEFVKERKIHHSRAAKMERIQLQNSSRPGKTL